VTEKFVFLSAEWVEAARAIRGDYVGQVPSSELSMKANVIVKDSPFAEPEVRGYIDTTAGTLAIEMGELDDAELTITIDYPTAQALFVKQDLSAVMEAFFRGQILVTGDVSRILSLSPPTDPDQLTLAAEISKRLDAITSS